MRGQLGRREVGVKGGVLFIACIFLVEERLPGVGGAQMGVLRSTVSFPVYPEGGGVKKGGGLLQPRARRASRPSHLVRR